MTTPSKLGPVVLSLFGLPFLGFGLFAAYSFFQAPNQPLAARIGAATFASVFAIIGGGLIFGSCYGYTLQKKQAAREQAQPGSPWLWREDWAAGRATGKNRASARGWWVAAVLLNMLFLPMTLGTLGRALQLHDPAYLLPAGLELLALLTTIGAVRATLRAQRFGQAYFELASLPFSPGGRVAGAIHLHLDSNTAHGPAHGMDLKLTCFRRVVTGSGDNRSSQQVPLWETSKNVPAAAFSPGPLDTAVPVEFQLPPDAFQTDHESLSDQVYWRLEASANMPGVDYHDEFELPVFRTSASAATSNSFASNAFPGDSLVSGRLAAGARPIVSFARSNTTIGELSNEVAEPARHRVVVEDSPAVLQFHFRAARNPGRALLVVILAAAVSALFYALLQHQRQTPLFAFVVVGLLEFFLILAVVHTALTATRITVENGANGARISWRHSILGIGRTRDSAISEVDSIVPLTGIQQASSSGSTQYSVRLKTKAGQNYTLIDEIESREEARWIVAQIEKRAGLRLNTQVEMNNSIYGPPPQPGAILSRR